jgi:hypothetical protein
MPEGVDITAELLKSARNKIDKDWIRGTWQRGKNVCAMGAIDWALQKEGEVQNSASWRTKLNCLAALVADEINPEAYRYRKAHGRGYADAQSTVIGFNDGAAKDKHDVLAVFDKAIATYEKEHPNSSKRPGRKQNILSRYWETLTAGNR